MTPQELIAKWRTLARECQVDARIAGGSVLLGTESIVLHRSADELASTLSTMRCETCKHDGGNVPGDPKGESSKRWCSFVTEELGSGMSAVIGSVPRLVNGHPFSCSAWAASPPLEETK